MRTSTTAYAQDDFRAQGRADPELRTALRVLRALLREEQPDLVNLDHNAELHRRSPGVCRDQVGDITHTAYNSVAGEPGHESCYCAALRLRVSRADEVPPQVPDRPDGRARRLWELNFNTGQPATFAKQLAGTASVRAGADQRFRADLDFAGDRDAWAAVDSHVREHHPQQCISRLRRRVAVSTNSYAVNKNYRLGHVQVYNLGIQKTLPLQTVLNIDYNGSVGGNLDVVRAPNRTATGVIDPSRPRSTTTRTRRLLAAVCASHQPAQAAAEGRQHPGDVSVRPLDRRRFVDRRQRNVTVAQNDLDLNAEEGNSSFLDPA